MLRQLFKACVATVSLSLACASAHADYQTAYNNVTFTFIQTSASSFTFKISNLDNRTGNWAPDTNLGFLAFKDLGPLAGITGATVTNVQPASSSVWTYSAQELNGNGCLGGNSGGICLDANPDILLANDMVFQINLLGTTLAIAPGVGPHLKVGFTFFNDKKGVQEIGGDLLSQNMPFVQGCTVNCGGGGSGGGGGTVPEPASVALIGLALLAAGSQARRQRRTDA